MSGQDSSDARNYAEGLVGRTLKGKWRLDSLIGVGGMASVFASTHRNGDRVAVKVLHPAYAVQPSVRNRFVREGYAANAVGHRGAVNVRDDEVDDDGIVFLVMELLDGETLDARWDRMGSRLPISDVLAIAEQLLDVLAAAHDKGIWHRDIKPDNVFLTRDGAVKVLDFGIAKVRDSSSSVTATQTGAMIGTPVFMPPEQVLAASKEVDGQSDIWSVGATMYSLLTGRFVHEALTPNEVLVKAATEPARKLRSLAPDVPECVANVVDRALQASKQERWPDARAMQAAVRQAREQLGLPSHFSPVPLSVQEVRVAGLAQTVDSTPGKELDALPHATTHLQATTPVEPGARSGSLPTSTPRSSYAQPRSTRRIWMLVAVATAAISAFAIVLATGPRESLGPTPTDSAPLSESIASPPASVTPPPAPLVAPATTEAAIPVASESAEPIAKKPPPIAPARPVRPKPSTATPGAKTADTPSMFDKR